MWENGTCRESLLQQADGACQQGGIDEHKKRLAIEAALQDLWSKVDAETFLAALTIFVRSRAIAADAAKQAEISQAWNQVLADLQKLEHIQANRDITSAFDDMTTESDWQEIDAAFDDLQHDLGW